MRQDRKRAIVVYDTVFGNTEKIAKALGAGLQQYGVTVDRVNIRSVQLDLLSEYDLIAVGGPTHYLSASEPMMDFLENLAATGLGDKYGFAFDTRTDYFYAGSASKYIEKKLERLGLRVLKPRGSALVRGLKGAETRAGEAVLEEGQEQLFEGMGNQLGSYLVDRVSTNYQHEPNQVVGSAP